MLRLIRIIYFVIAVLFIFVTMLCNRSNPVKAGYSYFVLDENCENGMSRWTAENWFVDSLNYKSPRHSFAIPQGIDDYASLKSENIIVRTSTEVIVKFWLNSDISLTAEDRLFFRANTSGEAPQYILAGRTFTHSVQGWREEQVTFTTSNSFNFRFYISSQQPIEIPWNIDDIKVICMAKGGKDLR